MGLIGNVPYRPGGADPRSIAGILANFDAITSEFDGGIENINVAEGAGIDLDKLETGTGGQLPVYNAAGKLQKRAVTGDVTLSDAGAFSLAANSVGSAEIAPDSVGSSEIAPDGVGSAELAPDSVGSSELQGGSVNGDKLTAPLAEDLGISQTGTRRRGFKSTAGVESRTNTAYGKLTTADEVVDVVLPSDGLIVVLFSCLWKCSVNDAGRAAIFLDDLVQTVPSSSSTDNAPVAQEAVTHDSGEYAWMTSTPVGLEGSPGVLGDHILPTNGVMAVGFKRNDLTPTQQRGGPCFIFAPADTYTVSIRFKSSSGQVDVKERKLWVWTMAF